MKDTNARFFDECGDINSETVKNDQNIKEAFSGFERDIKASIRNKILDTEDLLLNEKFEIVSIDGEFFRILPKIHASDLSLEHKLPFDSIQIDDAPMILPLNNNPDHNLDVLTPTFNNDNNSSNIKFIESGLPREGFNNSRPKIFNSPTNIMLDRQRYTDLSKSMNLVLSEGNQISKPKARRSRCKAKKQTRESDANSQGSPNPRRRNLCSRLINYLSRYF